MLVNRNIFYLVSFTITYTALAYDVQLFNFIRNNFYLTFFILLDFKFILSLSLGIFSIIRKTNRIYILFIFFLIYGILINIINYGSLSYALFKILYINLCILYFYYGIKQHSIKYFNYGLILNALIVVYQYFAHQHLNISYKFWHISEIIGNNALTVGASLWSSIFNPAINAQNYLEFNGYKYAGLTNEPAYFSIIALMMLLIIKNLKIRTKLLLIFSIILSFSYVTAFSLIGFYLYKLIDKFIIDKYLMFKISLISIFILTIILTPILLTYGGTFQNRFYPIELYFSYYDIGKQIFGNGIMNIYIPEDYSNQSLQGSLTSQGLVGSLLSEVGAIGTFLYLTILLLIAKNTVDKNGLFLIIIVSWTTGFLTMWPATIFILLILMNNNELNVKSQNI